MINIPNQFKTLNLIGSISWLEIFEIWRKGEAQKEYWRKHWQKKGFDSWEKWRNNYVASLKPETLSWFLFHFRKPIEELPKFYGAPTYGWMKIYKDGISKKLSEIITLLPEEEITKISNVKENFPKESMLTGLIFKNEIFLIEGMHRACALASWEPDRKFDSEISLALAEWNEKELPVLGSSSEKQRF